MKIGFLAMSGIRAHDPELLRLGLTLPGFVKRSKVIASLPSLGLLYLAAVTPEGHDLRYFEAEGDGNEPADVYTCDLVAISTFSAQVFEAYAVADRLRAAGVRVAMGGLHVTACREEAAVHADYVIVGEGEAVWPAVIEAAEREPVSVLPGGSRLFDSENFPAVDAARLPVPRYDLLMGRSFNRITVQTTRGCPWRCDFCASNVMLGRPYRKRPVEHVTRDIRAAKKVFPNAFFEFADDNTFVDKGWGLELCRELSSNKVRWFTETDITVADDIQLLDALREAGCRQLLIGLESPSATALGGVEMRADIKAKWAPKYLDRLRRIQSAGITVNGCFVLGLDGHTPDIFHQVLDFAVEVPLFDVQITVLTPFPGTPLYDRLLRQGRILGPRRWDLCTLFDVNFEPVGMTVDELRHGMRWLIQRLYNNEVTRLRREPFFREHRRL